MPPNALLSRLTQGSWAAIEPHLTTVALERDDVLGEPLRSSSRAVFPHSGVLSFVVELPGGGGVETGVVGWDGLFGGLQALGLGLAGNRVVIQVPGKASTIPLDILRKLMLELPDLRETVVRFEQFFLAQAQQTAACNAHHTVEQKLCRWLSRMYDLTGENLPLTQEFIAHMIGVRRTSVTDAAKAVQRLGIIEYQRGMIVILDKDQLERHGCECIAEVRAHYAHIMADGNGADCRRT